MKSEREEGEKKKQKRMGLKRNTGEENGEGTVEKEVK